MFLSGCDESDDARIAMQVCDTVEHLRVDWYGEQINATIRRCESRTSAYIR